MKPVAAGIVPSREEREAVAGRAPSGVHVQAEGDPSRVLR